MDSRLLTQEESMLLRDEHGHVPSEPSNFIIIRHPETGAILSTRRNLVVRTGRELNLRKIFDIPYASENKTKLDARAITCFGIGTGGTPSADPFNPTPPTAADVKLNTEVPFVITNTAGNTTNTSVYFDGRVSGSQTQYHKKAFSKKELVINNERDEVYVKLTLDVSLTDARGNNISELSLFFSLFDGG